MQILVVVANIQMKALKTEVGKGSMFRTAVGHASYEGIYAWKTLVKVSYFLSLFVSLRIINLFFDLSSQ